MNSSRRCLAPHDPGKVASGVLAPVAWHPGNGLLPGCPDGSLESGQNESLT